MFPLFQMKIRHCHGQITGQPQDGEVRSTLCEAGALPEARPPQARVRVDGRHDVIVEVLRGPLVHPGRCHYSRHPDQTEHEAHHLTQSGCHRSAVCETIWLEKVNGASSVPRLCA